MSRSELWKFKMNEIEDLKSALVMKLNNKKSKAGRSFTIAANVYNFSKNFFSFRNPNIFEFF